MMKEKQKNDLRVMEELLDDVEDEYDDIGFSLSPSS